MNFVKLFEIQLDLVQENKQIFNNIFFKCQNFNNICCWFFIEKYLRIALKFFFVTNIDFEDQNDQNILLKR